MIGSRSICWTYYAYPHASVEDSPPHQPLVVLLGDIAARFNDVVVYELNVFDSFDSQVLEDRKKLICSCWMLAVEFCFLREAALHLWSIWCLLHVCNSEVPQSKIWPHLLRSCGQRM